MHALPKILIKCVNLKQGMPLVREALARMDKELRVARQDGVAIVKFVHGYGSTGKGGEIRLAIQTELVQRQQRGELQAVIFGENWRISNEVSWTLLKKWPELKKDSDLSRDNRGITLVVL